MGVVQAVTAFQLGGYTASSDDLTSAAPISSNVGKTIVIAGAHRTDWLPVTDGSSSVPTAEVGGRPATLLSVYHNGGDAYWRVGIAVWARVLDGTEILDSPNNDAPRIYVDFNGGQGLGTYVDGSNSHMGLNAFLMGEELDLSSYAQGPGQYRYADATTLSAPCDISGIQPGWHVFGVGGVRSHADPGVNTHTWDSLDDEVTGDSGDSWGMSGSLAHRVATATTHSSNLSWLEAGGAGAFVFALEKVTALYAGSIEVVDLYAGSDQVLRLYAGGSLVWVNELTQPSPVPPQVEPVSFWTDKVDDLWSAQKSQWDDFAANPVAGDVVQLYRSGYGYEGLLGAYIATGDTLYASRLYDEAERWISLATRTDLLPDSQYRNRSDADQYYGWGNYLWETPTGQELILYESYGWRFFARLLWVTRNESSLATRHANLLSWTEQNIWRKWHARSPTTWYRENPHMAGHCAIIAMYLARLSDDATIQSQALTVSDNIMWATHPLLSYSGGPSSGWPSQSSIMTQFDVYRAQHPHPQEGQSPYGHIEWWSWTWTRYSSIGSDNSHGEAVVTACTYYWELMRDEADKHGYTDTFMSGLAGLGRFMIDNDSGTLSGTGTYPDDYFGQWGYAKPFRLATEWEHQVAFETANNLRFQDAGVGAENAYYLLGGSTTPDPGTQTGWAALPIRSAAEVSAGFAGGEGAQHNHGVSRIVNNVCYVAGDVHQLRKSTDGGQSWQYCPAAGLGVSQMFGVEVDSGDTNRVVVVGSAGFDYAESSATGIYLSTDGGDTFTLAQAIDHRNLPESMYDSDFSRFRPWRLVEHAGSTTWYVAIGDEGTGTDYGVWESTDSGATWSKQSGSLANLRVHTIRYAGGRLWLAGRDGLRYSDNGGDTLSTPSGTGLPSLNSAYLDLDVDPTNSGDSSDVLYVVQGGVYKSTNAGGSFTTVTPSGASGCRRVTCQADTAGHVFVMDGGVSEYCGWITDDGASTWTHAAASPFVGHKSRNGVGSGIGGCSWGTTSQLVAAGDAFIYYSSDGSTFDPSTGFTGLTAGRKTCFDFHPTDPDILAMTAYDNFVVRTTNAGESFAWPKQTDVSDGRVHTVAVAFNQSGTVGLIANRAYEIRKYSSGAWSTVVDSGASSNWYPFLRFHHTNSSIVYAGRKRSTNGGSTWSTLPPGLWMLDCATNNDIVWATTTADSGAAGIYRSTNAGATWTNVTGVLPSTISPKAHDLLVVFAAHPTSANIFYSKNSSGDLVRWEDGTVTALSVPSVTGNARYVRAVAVDPQNANLIYVAVKDVGASCVYVSDDAGGSWTDITGDLARSSLNIACHVSPTTGDLFVSGTYQGVFVYPRPADHPAATTTTSYRDRSWMLTW